MSDQLQGVLPALITPFTDDGTDLDAEALAAIVERVIAAGVGGLVPGGSTGEFTTLSHAERRRLVEVTVEAAAGRVPVVAGTGALSTAETIELSVHAERSGAAAVMIVPPFYDPLGWRELLAHYRAVADQIAIPIMYYNLPGATGVTLDSDQFRELRRVAGVSSLKDTGGDAVVATELIHAGEDTPVLLNGWDTLTFAAARRGCARRRMGCCVDPSGAVRSAAPVAHRRHRPSRGSRALGPAMAAMQLPRAAQLPGRRQGRLRLSRRQHRSGAWSAAATR